MGTFSCSIFFGGMLLIIAGIFEFILGNNFPFLVFMGYGAHFLSFATTFQPTFHQISFYSNGDPYQSGVTPAFAASFGEFPHTEFTDLYRLRVNRILPSVSGHSINRLLARRSSHQPGLRAHLHQCNKRFWFRYGIAFLHRPWKHGSSCMDACSHRSMLLCGRHFRLVSLFRHGDSDNGTTAA